MAYERLNLKKNDLLDEAVFKHIDDAFEALYNEDDGKQYLEFPCEYSGSIILEQNPSKIYWGTRNIFAMPGIVQGTFTKDDLTITIDGSHITVSGKVSSASYFNLVTGNWSGSGLTTLSYDVPAGTYRFSWKGSGSYAPSLIIRSTSSGNKFALSNGKYSEVLEVADGELGVPCLYFGTATINYAGNVCLVQGDTTDYVDETSVVNSFEGIGQAAVWGYVWAKDNANTKAYYIISEDAVPIDQTYSSMSPNAQSGVAVAQAVANAVADCVKTINGQSPDENGNVEISVSSGGGGSGEVDQAYTPESQNAQSGVAVAQAIAEIAQKQFVEANQDNEAFTVIAGKTVGSSGGVSTSANYTVWQMVAEYDFDMYFSANNYKPAGGYLALGANGQRYASSSSNLPTADAPVHITAGQTVNISVYTVGSAFTFYWNPLYYLANNIKLSDTLMAEIANSATKRPFYKMQDSSLYFFVPSHKTNSQNWLRFTLAHSVSTENNYDVWRLDAVNYGTVINGVWSNTGVALSGGEWACALKIKGATDFMGGSYHGDEVSKNAYLYIDGSKKELNTGETEFFDEIKVVENTELFNPDVANEKAADVTRIITITKDVITIDQKVAWVNSYTMDLSYVAMCCAMRVYNDVQITDTGYADSEYVEYDITSEGFDNPLYINNANCVTNRKMITVYGNNIGLNCEVKCTHISPELETRPTYVYNGTPYNKIYMSFCPANYKVSVGDVWEAKYEYRIKLNK